ncbi:MAG TPA: DNA-directed RNA polymerase subunit omega [Bryobacteraceae bacterium]
MKLSEGMDSRYRFVIVAAKRARQLQAGAQPTLEPNTRKACKLAQDELMAGNVKWTRPEPPASYVPAASEVLEAAPPTPEEE